MSKATNLEHIKVGDFLAIQRNLTGANLYLPPLIVSEVTKVTPKQIVLSNERRVWRHNGEPVGESWYRYFSPTEEQIKEHRQKVAERKRYVALLRWLDDTVLKDRLSLTIEQLEALKAGLETTTEAKQ